MVPGVVASHTWQGQTPGTFHIVTGAGNSSLLLTVSVLEIKQP